MRFLLPFLSISLLAGDVQSLSCINHQALPPYGTVNADATLLVNQPSFFGKIFGKKKITSVIWTVNAGADQAKIPTVLEGANKFTIGNSQPSNIKSVQVNKTSYPVTCK